MSSAEISFVYITKYIHLVNLFTIINIVCYGPYKQDSTSTKKGLVLDQNQCAEYRTDGTSRAIG